MPSFLNGSKRPDFFFHGAIDAVYVISSVSYGCLPSQDCLQIGYLAGSTFPVNSIIGVISCTHLLFSVITQQDQPCRANPANIDT